MGDLIAVDDVFFDGSASILDRLALEDSRVYNYTHIRNQGKVAAQRTGISKAAADIVLIEDAVFSSRLIGSNKHCTLNSGPLVEPTSTRSPSPTTVAPMPKGRKSDGGMA